VAGLGLTVEVRVGEGDAIYLPKAVVEAMGLREGSRVLLRVSGDTLIVEALQDPILLALSGRKFARIDPEEAEAISLGEQAKRTEGSARHNPYTPNSGVESIRRLRPASGS